MKKISVAFLMLFMCLLVSANKTEPTTTEVKDTIRRQNEISLVITDLIDGSYQFRYERKLGKHLSIGLGVAYKTKDGLVGISGIDRERIQTGDIEYSGFKLVPDVRYYLNKTQQYELDGFYFGAYMKYFDFSSNINGNYTSIYEKDYVIDINADMNILSMGLMVGYKLAISKRFNIDFLIFGPGASRQSYSLENKEPLPDEFYDDLNQSLENLSLYDFVNSDFRFNFKKSRSSFTTASFRYGLTVGYTF